MDPLTVTLVLAVFLLAGLVKGVLGLGLPTVCLALITLLLDLPQAMALLLVPSLATNLWQASSGGAARAILVRLWPFLLAATLAVALGAPALDAIALPWLRALLGLLLAAYAAFDLLGLRLTVAPASERWAGPLAGIANGVLTGMTGSFVMPGVPYLQAIGLGRDVLVQAMGMLFTASTIALALALGAGGRLSDELALVSLAGLVPALLGMALGRRIRKAVPPARFRRLFFVALLLLGLDILVTGLP